MVEFSRSDDRSLTNPARLEQRLLAGEPDALRQVSRLIAAVLASTRFWRLRIQWTDIHQETMMRVVESLRRGRFDASRDFRVYVQAVARYTAMETLKLQDRGPEIELGNASRQAEDGGAETRIIRRQLVRVILQAATPECRELILAYFFEQRDYEEIASSTNAPVGTVKSKLFRCLEGANRAMRRSGSTRARAISR